MPRSLVVISSLLLVSASGYAQEDLAARDRAIQEAYEAEDHAKVVRAIDRQLSEAQGTAWQDSVFRYCYEYGRANWKIGDAGTGGRKAEEFRARVLAWDKNAEHDIEMLSDLSWLYYEMGRSKDCLRVDSLAIAVADASLDVGVILRGRTRQYLGFDRSYSGDHTGAARAFLEAVAIYEAADTLPVKELAEAYNGVGASYWHLGRNKEAEAQYMRSLELLADAKDPELLARKASSLGNLAIMWHDAGDLVRSGAYHQQVLTIWAGLLEQAKDPSARDDAILNRSRTYVNLASLYYSMGQYGTSRSFVDLAFADRSKVLEPDDPKLLSIQELYADLEAAAGDHAKAAELETRYLQACERRFGKRSEQYTRALSKVARSLDSAGDHEQADPLFKEAIALQRSMADPLTDPVLAEMLLAHAEILSGRKAFGDALPEVNEAREILVRIHGPMHRKVAQCRIIAAQALLAMGRVEEAERSIEEALVQLGDRRIGSMEVPLPRSDLLPQLLPDALFTKVQLELARSGGRASVVRALDDLDDAIRALSVTRNALQDEESKLLLLGAQQRIFSLARALAFREYQRTGEEAWKNKVFKLSEQDRTILLKNRLNAYASLSYSKVPARVLEREVLLQEELAAHASDPASAAQLHTHEEAYGSFLDSLRRQHPAYFAMKYGDQEFGISEVQRELLAPGQSLVAYSMADTALYAVVICRDQADIVRLGAEGVKGLVEQLNTATAKLDQGTYLRSAHALHERIFAPVRPLLCGTEIFVIPDGCLHSVDLELLLAAPSTMADMKEHLLIREFTISYLLSASTAIRFKQLDRARGRGALAMAPGFSDELKQGYITATADTNGLDRAFLRHIQQPFAVRTARELGDVMSARVMVGAEATEARFRAMAEKYGIIHLGTHTEINNASPLYSKLVLSKQFDGDGDGDGDGYLHAYEIYEMQLGAELAVLTACGTGSGRFENGEGVRSLAHGFAYAGCPSLVMSLWNIDEKTSGEIIAGFYRYLAEGYPKNAALRQAKLDYLDGASEELSAPYYWAGMVLVGDVAPVHLEGDHRSWWPIALGLCIVVGLLWWWRRSRRSP